MGNILSKIIKPRKMTHKQKEEMLKTISDLLDVQQNGRAQVFINYSGHSDYFDVKVYSPVYHMDVNPILQEHIFLDVSSPKKKEEFNRKIYNIIDILKKPSTIN